MEEIEKIIKNKVKATCCKKPIIAYDEDKKIYNCLNCNMETSN